MSKSILENDVVLAGASRKQWPNQAQFLCANIAFAVGLGNIWRFPYLAQVNGGGTFLIPYFCSLIIIGFPILTLELSLGQRLREGAFGSYTQLHRGFAGVGFAMVVVSVFVGLYYNMIVGWAFFYFLQSFQDPLPWASCPLTTQNVSCTSGIPGAGSACTVAGSESMKNSLMREVTQVWQSIPWPNEECTLAGSPVYFWYRETLNVTSDYLPLEGLNENMTLVLFLAWVVVFMISMNGSQAAGGMLYFIALTPYVVLAIFLVIGLITDGGLEGLSVLFQADWERLGDAKLWVDASSQIFFSLSVCYGGIIAFSSYNPVNQNLLRDSGIVASVNSGTSILATLVIFALLGNRAWLGYEKCLTSSVDNVLNFYNNPEDYYGTMDYDEIYDEVNKTVNGDLTQLQEIFGNPYCDFARILNEDTPSGTGLIFIAVAEAVINIPGSFILSMIFFFMVIMLGLGSMVGTFEGVITPLYDVFEGTKLTKVPKPAMVGLISCIFFSVGILFTTNAGNYWVDIMNDFSASINLLVIGVTQILIIAYMFGGRKWYNEIEWMINPSKNGFKKFVYGFLKVYILSCWYVLAPLLIIFVLIYFIIDLAQNPPTYRKWDASTGGWLQEEDADGVMSDVREPYDELGLAIIAMLHLICLLPIPIMAIKSLWQDRSFRLKNWRYPEGLIYRTVADAEPKEVDSGPKEQENM